MKHSRKKYGKIQQKKNGQIKVLHVLKSDCFSGAEYVAMTICRHCNEQFLSAYASKKGEIRNWLDKNGIAYYPMKQLSLRELNRVLRQYQPDLVHAHDFTASVLCALAKRRFYLISHLHNDPPWIRRWNIRSVCYRLVQSRMDRILLVSDAIRKEAVFFKGCQDKLFVVGNPLDTDLVEKRAAVGLAEHQPYSLDLLFVGRLTRQKAPERFIRIVRRLHKSGMPVHAVMIGDGELSEKCRSLIQRFGLTDAICMKGFLANPYPYMKQAKFLIITSGWEGFGLVASEALALGTPVLASPSGGLRNQFRHFPQALCRSEKEFAAKTARLLSDKRRYEQFRLEMMDKVSVSNLETYMRGIQSVYEEVRL